MLVRRNREIAEVREELLKMEQCLNTSQQRNASLLEETSVLDSTISQHSGRAAISEHQWAEVLGEAKDREEELSRHRAAHAARVAALQDELRASRELFDESEAEASAKRAGVAGLDADAGRLRGLLQEEDEKLLQLRRGHVEPAAQAAASAAAVAARSMKDQLEAICRRQEAESDEAAAARHRAGALQAELEAERRRRDEVGGSLRQEVVDQAEDPARLQRLEAAVAARGSDVQALLHGPQGGAPAASGGAGAPDRAAELRSELQASEGQCRAFRESLERTREDGAQAATQLQAQLEGARMELQRSLKEAADAHNSEVARLEGEIQAERQRASDEEVAQRLCADQLTQLGEAQARALDEQSTALRRALAEKGRRAALADELKRVHGEARATEQRAASLREHADGLERKRQEAQAEGQRRAAKVRAMIESLWQGLREARAATPGVATGW